MTTMSPQTIQLYLIHLDCDGMFCVRAEDLSWRRRIPGSVRDRHGNNMQLLQTLPSPYFASPACCCVAKVVPQ